MMVKSELEKLGISYMSVELGEVELCCPIDDITKNRLKEALQRLGLQLMYDKKAVLIEKIINIIIKTIHYNEEIPRCNFSDFLSDRLNKNYHYLAEIFSKTKGITIEHFIILHKVEKIKELMIYDELTLTEISYKLHYCSVSHLSKQFKKITGLTPSAFKKISKHQRKNIEDL